MKHKQQEIRIKADFTLPCPECDAVCRPDDVTFLKKRTITTPDNKTVVLPSRYLDMQCVACGFVHWVALDETGRPLREDDL